MKTKIDIKIKLNQVLKVEVEKTIQNKIYNNQKIKNKIWYNNK